MLESLLRHLGGKKMWLVGKDDSIPLFEGQEKFDPLVRIHKYWVRTDKNRFIPEIYQIKFVFYEIDPLSPMQPRQSEVHMPREVADWLLTQGFEGQIKNLEIVVDDKNEVPIVIPDKVIN